MQLFLNVLDYELDDGPMLSEGADSLVEQHPIAGRVFIVSVGSIITLHLANLMDERYDLLAQSFWKRLRKGR
ncbi:hypothetical protein DQP57_00180 [Mycobacterium colombiense]|uniref:Uncharacterized protein n=2 Tax=Mycobacterium colombiense TaxID=339268 RepID=A0A329MBP0_9MYCO|nr:hypothetical protein DQP57_00180 [Mycobacterium colombiense]